MMLSDAAGEQRETLWLTRGLSWITASIYQGEKERERSFGVEIFFKELGDVVYVRKSSHPVCKANCFLKVMQ